MRKGYYNMICSFLIALTSASHIV